jgi:hypothetical protein
LGLRRRGGREGVPYPVRWSLVAVRCSCGHARFDARRGSRLYDWRSACLRKTPAQQTVLTRAEGQKATADEAPPRTPILYRAMSGA